MTCDRIMRPHHANALPGAYTSRTCTDGRTDGQNVEPPSQRDHLELCDACEKSGIFAAISRRSNQGKAKAQRQDEFPTTRLRQPSHQGAAMSNPTTTGPELVRDELRKAVGK